MMECVFFVFFFKVELISPNQHQSARKQVNHDSVQKFRSTHYLMAALSKIVNT